MSTESKLKETFARPLVVGAVSALGAMAMGQRYTVVTPLGEISAPVMYGLLGVSSSLAAETLHQWILPYIPGNDPELVKMENALISPALHAAVNLAVLRVIVPGAVTTLDWKTPAIIGAGAEVVGGYAFDNFLKAKLA